MFVDYTLSVHEAFEAAHDLPRHSGKCNELHGHRWEVDIQVKIQLDTCVIACVDGTGMIVDFGELKTIVKSFDHAYLNDHFKNPTAEVIATHLMHRAAELIPYDCIVAVTVQESPDNAVTVFGNFPVEGLYDPIFGGEQ